MRRNPTKAEAALWEELRRRPYGLKFRRQEIILGWIVDFYCAKGRTVIEIDGGYHDDPIQAERDRYRDTVLKKHHIRTIRFSNEEVINDRDLVLEKIFVAVKR